MSAAPVILATIVLFLCFRRLLAAGDNRTRIPTAEQGHRRYWDDD